jgi:alpha-galactosidase
MLKIVFIGAGSQFGATSFVDLLSFPELHDCEVVLVDVNSLHLAPVAAYARKVVAHYHAPTKVAAAANWRDRGVLDGADFVITSFAQGGLAYASKAYYNDIAIPLKYGVQSTVADTIGFGGIMRMLRTGPELLAIGRAMERQCPRAILINYVNPMSMLTRALCLGAPKIRTYGLCHNIQGGIREIARYIGCTCKDLRFTAAGVNHLCWFLSLEYLDGRNAYPDLLRAAGNPENYRSCASKFELLKQFGFWSGEGPNHVAEYVPYFLPRDEDRESVFVKKRVPPRIAENISPRWGPESDLVQQLNGARPLELARSTEYGVRIVHAAVTGNKHRMHLNIMNNGLISNFPDDTCVEVCCTADRTAITAQPVGRMPVQVAALCRAMADMQTLASDGLLEKDLDKVCHAAMLDPLAAACARPQRLRECFNDLLESERDLLEPEWGGRLRV